MYVARLLCSSLAAFCVSSSHSVAGGLAGADDGGLGVHDGDVIELEVTCGYAFADCKRSYIYSEVIGEILKQAADFEFATAYLELTAGAYAHGVTGDYYGNLYNDGLLVVYSKKVGVKSVVLNGMILNLVEECGELGTVYVEIYDVAVRGVGEGLESLCIDTECGVFDAVAINYARHLAFAANLADVSFAAKVPLGTGESQMFH